MMCKPTCKGLVVRSTTPMEWLHTDVCRPFPVATKTGKCYFISIIDDATRFAVVVTIHNKSNIKAVLCSHLAVTSVGLKCCCLCSDQGGEYTSEQVQGLLCTTGIVHEATLVHTPEHNGVAERFNRTIVEMVWCMLHDSGLALSYWGKALRTTTVIYNHLPTNTNDRATPLDQWDANHMGALKDMHQFGAKVEVLVPPGEQNKLSARTCTGVYLGLADSGTSNHWVLVQGCVLVMCEVVFPYDVHDVLVGNDMPAAVAPAVMNPAKEASVDAALQEASIDQSATLAPSVLGASGSVESLPPHSPTPVELSTIERTPQGKSPVQVEPPDPLMLPDMPVLDDNPALEESKEVGHAAPPSLEADDIIVATKKKWPTLKKPPACKHKKNTKFYNDDFRAFTTEVLQALNVSNSACTPNSYDEAIASPEAAEWIKAMKAEYGALNCNSTFELALLPAGLHAIRSKWLYKIKSKASGVIDRLKVRWVGKGYAQRLGINYDKTFSPVVTMEHLHQLLALAAILDLKVHQMDIKNAFLNAMLSICIYIEQPQGFVDLEWPDHVCLLHKSLYGLRQAPLKWNRMMDRHLRGHHFLPTCTNPCIYMLQESSAHIIITVYIDDCVIVTPLKHVERTKMVLHDGFRMKDLGQARSILGMEVMHDREEGALYLRQASKIMEILHDFGMADTKSISTPMDPGLILHKLKAMAPGHLRMPYHSVVGRLSYLSQAMCPDIAFTVNVLSHHINGYNQSHWGAIKHLLQYLRATKDLAIKYATSGSHSQSGSLLLVGYMDADWGRDVKTWHSTSGVLFTLSGSPIRWGARTQKCVATSMMEAELNAIAETIKEAAHLNGITSELFPHVNAKLQLYCDNQSAVVIAKSKPGEHAQCTKHYALKLMFLRESVSKLNIDFKYLPTEVMPANMFTKALGRTRVVELRSLINLVKLKIESKGRVV